MTLTTTTTGRGQHTLTDQARDAICTYYGWTTTPGYEDRGQVFIGSSYAGRVLNDTLVLDRNVSRREADKWELT